MEKIKIRIKKGKKVGNGSVISEAFLMIAVLLISTFAFAALLSPNVKAQALTTQCCEKTKDNAYCQNYLNEVCTDKCSENCLPTTCEASYNCKLGCCYDSDEGTCAENTPRKVCETGNGTWSDTADCSIPQCQLGCCVLSDEAQLVTLVKCKKLSSYYGVEINFRADITTESECVDLTRASEEGACVFAQENEKTCKFTTRGECREIEGGEFHKDFLCSAEELGTNCAKLHRSGCTEGKDEVYWFDSCNNPENIYDSNKERAWNGGRVLPKDKSCNANSANIKNKDCGNCEYFSGSICGKARSGVEPKPTYGDYICRDLNCYDTFDGTDRKHGESWCVYDSAVGKGKDVVGSRHWLHTCIMGEEKVEPCADLRQEVCMQDSIETEKGEFSSATCMPNRWRECLGYNDINDTKEKIKLCTENSNCFWSSELNDLNKQTTMEKPEKQEGESEAQYQKRLNDYYNQLEKKAGKLQICLPSYPPGLNFWEESAAASQCSAATVTAKKGFVKKCFGIGSGWKCVENCEVGTQAWLQKMNNFCSSLGDCGAEANIAGEVTTYGYSASANSNSKGQLSDSYLNTLKKLVKPTYATTSGLAILGQVISGKAIEAESKITVKVASNTFNWRGIPVTLEKGELISGEGADALANAAKEAGFGVKKVAEGWEVNSLPQQFKLGPAQALAPPQWVPTYAYPLWFAIAAYMAAKIVANLFGLSQPYADALTKAGTMTGAVYGIAKGNLIKGFSWQPVYGWVLFALVLIFSCKKHKVVTYTFTCMPWQPPSGGEDCTLCNKNPEMLPCSEYRCKSLGASCELLNEGTTKELCEYIGKDDVTAPTLTPWREILSFGHSYKSVTPCPPGPGCFKVARDNAKDGCIKAFTPLALGVKTNEPAQCKLDDAHTSDFEEMKYWLGDNLYLYEHSINFSLPGPTHLKNETGEELTGEENPIIKNDGKYTFYIRCKDKNGNFNRGEMAVQFCVEPGPDTTPPVIERTSIINGAPVPYGASSMPLSIFLNEPAECKWGKIDQAYENMNNTFTCATTLDDREVDFTYACTTTLTNVKDKQENVFYIRCKDQPNAAESERNVNKQSYVFKLQGTQQLNITKTSPNGTLYFGGEPVTINLEAETANGYANGDATCFFSAVGYEEKWPFFSTGGNKHSQKLELVSGSYTHYIQCKDEAGNIARAKASFNIVLDKTAPTITRVYKEGSLLKIITDETSNCAYSIKDCNFAVSREKATETLPFGIEMPFTNSTEHTAEWRVDSNYYIICEDIYGNAPGACSMIVHPYEVPQEE